MEENTNIWNKKMDELTVKDAVIVNAAMPIIAIGGVVAAGAVLGVGSTVVNKVQSFRVNRQNKITGDN